MPTAVEIKLTGDRDPSESKPLLHVQNVLHEVVRAKDDRLVDEAVLVPLDRAHHRRLRLRRLVVVDDADAAEELQRRGEKNR